MTDNPSFSLSLSLSLYIYVYIRHPLVGHQAAEIAFKLQVTVQAFCCRSPVQCWYLFTSFQVLGTCLIATGTPQVHDFTLTFGWIHLAIALRSDILDSSKTVLLLKWEHHLAPCGVPLPPQVCPNGTKGMLWTPQAPSVLKASIIDAKGLPNGANQHHKAATSKQANQPSAISNPASHKPQNWGWRQGAKSLGYIYIYIYIYVYIYILTYRVYMFIYDCIYPIGIAIRGDIH